MTNLLFYGFIICMNVDSVSFGAKPINSVKIKKYDKNIKNFVDFPATFVKLEPNNYFDIKAADVCASKWKDAKYIQKIATASHWMESVPLSIYAVTTQKNKFNKLKPNKILGFVEMRKDENRPIYDWLYYLQVKPQAINVNNSESKSYKHVGKSIIASLKKIYKNISLYSEDNDNIEKFYQSNGFIQDYTGVKHYVWSSNIFRMLKVRYESFRLHIGI